MGCAFVPPRASTSARGMHAGGHAGSGDCKVGGWNRGANQDQPFFLEKPSKGAISSGQTTSYCVGQLEEELNGVVDQLSPRASFSDASFTVQSSSRTFPSIFAWLLTVLLFRLPPV